MCKIDSKKINSYLAILMVLLMCIHPDSWAQDTFGNLEVSDQEISGLGSDPVFTMPTHSDEKKSYNNDAQLVRNNKGGIGFVFIRPKTKYNFYIENTSKHIPIQVLIDGYEPVLVEAASEISVNKRGGDRITFRLDYPVEIYEYMQDNITKQLQNLGVWDQLRGALTEEMIFNWDDTPREIDDPHEYDEYGLRIRRMETESEVIDRNLERVGLTVIFSAIAKADIERQKKELLALYIQNEKVFAAAKGAENEYAYLFEEVTMEVKGGWGVTAMMGLDANFLAVSQWNLTAEEDGFSGLAEAYNLSFLLSPEFKFGRWFGRFYGMFSYERLYKVPTIDSSQLYIPGAYVQNSAQPYQVLLKDANVKVGYSNFSAGAFWRMHCFPRFYFDLGGGMGLNRTESELEFEGEEPHIEGGTLIDHEIPDVLESPKSTFASSYGMFRVGMNFAGRKGDYILPNWKHYMGYYLTLSYFIRNVEMMPNSRYQLYQQTGTAPNVNYEILPLMPAGKTSEIIHGLYLGIGASF